MTPPSGGTYDQVRQALDDERTIRGEMSRAGDGGKWPAWINTALAVLAVISALFLAYGALDKRLALVEQALAEQRQKLDLIIYQQNGKR